MDQTLFDEEQEDVVVKMVSENSKQLLSLCASIVITTWEMVENRDVMDFEMWLRKQILKEGD